MAKFTNTYTTLVTNGDLDPTSSHESCILQELASATDFVCLAAYASYSVFQRVLKALKARLDHEPTFHAHFYIGLDFYRTDPEILRSLLNLGSKKQYGKKVATFVSAKYPPDVFYHPKVYLFRQANGSVKAIIGSANLTQGGLKSNYEMSVLVETNTPEFISGIEDFIIQMTASPVTEEDEEEESTDEAYLVPLTKDLITEYEKKHAIYNVHMRLAERKIKRITREIYNSEDSDSSSISIPQTDTLADILREMRMDHSESGFNASIQSRRTDRNNAITQLSLIRDEEPRRLSRLRFLELYDPLITGTPPFWKSGFLYRGKTTIAKQTREFQRALQQFDSYYRLHGKEVSIENIYHYLFGLLAPIKSAGTNVLTEILHTYDNTRFPVMNQNSVAGIGLAGFHNFPSMPSKTNLTPARYTAFCTAAESVRIDLKLKNFSELDTLFNYAYWNYDEDEDEDEDEVEDDAE